MTDVRIKETYSALDAPTMDWFLKSNGQLDDSEELATAVRIALGTDAQASKNEILPDPDSTDRRGWWGDLEANEIWGGWPIGTKNWLLSRAKITPESAEEGSTMERAYQYTMASLQPFIDNGICSDVVVNVRRTELQRIEVWVKIYRGPLLEIDLRYQMLWENIDNVPVADQPKFEGVISGQVGGGSIPPGNP